MIRWNNGGMLGLGRPGNVGGSAGDMGDALQDTDLGTDFVVIQLVAGVYHTCALSNNSKVKCWG